MLQKQHLERSETQLESFKSAGRCLHMEMLLKKGAKDSCTWGEACEAGASTDPRRLSNELGRGKHSALSFNFLGVTRGQRSLERSYDPAS